MLRRMEERGKPISDAGRQTLEVASDGIFAGKTILFTGTLTTMGRKEAEELAAKHGAKKYIRG